MGDYRPSPVHIKKTNFSNKFSKEIIILQKPKSKTRVSSPEAKQKISTGSNKNSQSNIPVGNLIDAKFLEPKYRDLLAKYLAGNSRQTSPQDSRPSSRSKKQEKKMSHRKVSSYINSPVVSKPVPELTKVGSLDHYGNSQERTIKNDQRRNGSLEQKFSHSSSSKNIDFNADLENLKKEQEETNKKEKLMLSILSSIKTGNIIPTNSKFYIIGKQLGKGAFGKVYLGLHRITGLKVAIKAIDKSIIQNERTRRKVFQEVYIMKTVTHPNVIRLLEVFESNRHLMIVLEYSGGGDLLQLVKSRVCLTNEEGKQIFSQVIDAVKACHTKNVIHRDVKLDNLLINTDFTCIKLCDFGVSRSVKPGERIFDQCGTPAYLAPEIIADRGYDPFYVDIWSMGVLLYAILSGTVPFRAKTLPELHKLILRCKFDIPDHVSPAAQNLIRKMLNPIPHQRISLDDMKTHPWFGEIVSETYNEDSIAPKFLGGFLDLYKKGNEKEILNKMKTLGFPIDFVYQSLKLREINHATATYYLLEVYSQMGYG
jgi:Protein kinase domain